MLIQSFSVSNAWRNQCCLPLTRPWTTAYRMRCMNLNQTLPGCPPHRILASIKFRYSLCLLPHQSAAAIVTAGVPSAPRTYLKNRFTSSSLNHAKIHKTKTLNIVFFFLLVHGAERGIFFMGTSVPEA